MAFASFKPVSMADVPDYITASALDDQAKANAYALRNKDIMGGVSLYNEAMGDNTPIADYISSFGQEEAVPEMIAAATPETVANIAPAGMDTMLAELMNPTAQAALGAGEGVLAPVAGETIANLAAPTAAEALTASALGTEALGIGAGAMAPAAGATAATAAGSVLPPLGIAMALGSLLGLFG